MKELSEKEKAKRYDEAIEKFKPIYDLAKKENRIIDVKEFEDIFPELKESEDEKIRKALMQNLKERFGTKGNMGEGLDMPDVLAWLEKQGEQDNNEDEAILHRFSFYSYKDEPNILYLAGLYVNEECHNKGIGTKILEVADEVAKSLDCYTIRLKTKKDSDAERLYQTHGYNSLAIEERDWIWLEKKSEQKETLCDKCRREHPSHSCQDITELGRCAVEQKPADKVEPKFHEGDWIVQGYNILKIKCVGNTHYCFETVGGYVDDMLISEIDSQFHLWTIQDAKDGDVLCSGQIIVIFKHFEDPSYRQHIVAYIGLDTSGNVQITDGIWTLGIDKARPATKEQRDTLFAKMKEAGYEWDAEKKELKMVEKSPAWSEEDKEIIEALNDYVKNLDILFSEIKIGDKDILSKEFREKVQHFLKSLKDRLQPQKQWKPSDKDIKLLKELSDGKICPDNYRTRLYEIINNLKNL